MDHDGAVEAGVLGDGPAGHLEDVVQDRDAGLLFGVELQFLEDFARPEQRDAARRGRCPSAMAARVACRASS